MRLAKTKNTIKGSFWGIINRIVCTIFPFIVRTVIIKVFGTDYLGLNSLFTSVLHVLNLSELGLSSAIVFHMYKPVADDDYLLLSALLNLYRKLYLIIGIVITVMGLVCMPFLPWLIKQEYPASINIYWLYLIFLSNTSISYFFFAYKESILYAFQKNDTLNQIRLATFLALYSLQIIVLFLVKNYYIYAGLLVAFTLIRGGVTSFVVDRMFPMIRPRGKVDQNRKHDIKTVALGAAIGKISAATRGSCDDIVVSSFLGLTALAIFDNYYYVMAAIVSMLTIIELSLSGGVGNSIAKENEEKNYADYQVINFFFMWIVGVCTVCLICLYQPFMLLWVGPDLMLDYVTMALFCGYFFSSGMSSIPSVYSSAAGLWPKMKLKSLFEVVFNLALNIIMVRVLGIKGILIATICSLVLIAFVWGTIVLKKNYFRGIRIKDFIVPQFLYMAGTAVACATSILLCELLTMESFLLTIAIRLAIGLFVSNVLFFLFYFKTEVFKTGVTKLRNGFEARRIKKENGGK